MFKYLPRYDLNNPKLTPTECWYFIFFRFISFYIDLLMYALHLYVFFICKKKAIAIVKSPYLHLSVFLCKSSESFHLGLSHLYQLPSSTPNIRNYAGKNVSQFSKVRTRAFSGEREEPRKERVLERAAFKSRYQALWSHKLKWVASVSNWFPGI